jgi:DedD protein
MARKHTSPKKGANKRYQIEMGPFSLFLWGCCALFFLAWIFVLGVLVGRGFLPGPESAFEDLKKQVAKLQEMTGKSKREEQTPQEKYPVDETLAFYARLEGKEEAAQKKGSNRPASKEGGAQRALEETSGRLPGKENRMRSETQKPDSGIQPPSVPPGEGAFTLQLASLEEKAKAESLVRDLLSKGHDAYFYEVQVKGKTYFRVRCGRFTTRAEANEYAARLLQSLNMKGVVSHFE